MTPVQEGQVLAGKYRVERVLGVGGMGVVVAALHIALDERVAIKFLLPEALSSPEAVARFAREARAAVKIKSLHVARVSDVGVLETGAPYMVMEFLQGQDLSQRIRDGGPLPISDAVDFVLQASEALAEAHALGMVHRDLKPANLFLTRMADGSPCVKVLDFGISKVSSPASSGPDFSMTKTHAVMGSPLYMSPEQMASTRNVDARTDIWALGTILYELLSGRVPFLGDTMPELCSKILQEQPPSLRQVRPDLPELLEQTIFRCLEKDRNRRYPNVAELAHALLPFGSQHAARSVERIAKVLTAAGISSNQLESPPATVASGTTEASWGKTGRRSQKSGVWAALVVAGALAVGGAFAAWRALRPTAVRESPAALPAAASAAPAVTPSAPQLVVPPPATVLAAPPSATGSAPPPAASPAPAPRVNKSTARTRAKKNPAAPTPVPAPTPRARPTIDPLDVRR